MRESPILYVACGILAGCGAVKQILSTPTDLADYRAFRLAEGEGARLERAQHYLESHPVGTWAGEVRLIFDQEESAWFEAAKQSRVRARDYVAELPRGPHSEAARALLVLYDERESNIDTLVLLARTRGLAAALELEAAQRRRLEDVVLEDLAALLDPMTWGARLDEPPPALERALLGSTRTWPGKTPALRQDELFFSIRSPAGIQERAAPLRLGVTLDHGSVTEGRIEGTDLFVRWTEAAQARPLDASKAEDRALAAAAVVAVLAGAVEARLPATHCAATGKKEEIMARSCSGWALRVQMGARAGAEDAIYVRGPQVDRAPSVRIR